MTYNVQGDANRQIIPYSVLQRIAFIPIILNLKLCPRRLLLTGLALLILPGADGCSLDTGHIRVAFVLLEFGLVRDVARPGHFEVKEGGSDREEEGITEVTTRRREDQGVDGVVKGKRRRDGESRKERRNGVLDEGREVFRVDGDGRSVRSTRAKMNHSALAQDLVNHLAKECGSVNAVDRTKRTVGEVLERLGFEVGKGRSRARGWAKGSHDIRPLR